MLIYRLYDRLVRQSLGQLLCFLLVSSGLSATSSWANTDDQAAEITALVEQTLEAALLERYIDSRYTINVLPLPAANHLKPCIDLNAEVRAKNLYGRVPVLVRCTKPASWSLYAGAQVNVETLVWVANHGIARGERISAADMTQVPRPLHSLRAQTITTAEDAIGKVARRAIRADTAITLNQLTVPFAVHKGERVHILATRGRVQIQSFGTAMANGRVGEQIQVRNEASQRIIRPWVVATGQVATQAPNFDS